MSIHRDALKILATLDRLEGDGRADDARLLSAAFEPSSGDVDDEQSDRQKAA